MITRQLNILIQLATIDGTLAGKERKLIEHIAKVNNVDDEVIKKLMNQPEKLPFQDQLQMLTVVVPARKVHTAAWYHYQQFVEYSNLLN